MGNEQNLFESLSAALTTKQTDMEESQMFGKPCVKINGKAFTCFFENAMVFKLTGNEHASAIKLKGAKLFDPSGKGRAMKEWVQVPFAHHEQWEQLAIQAIKYVSAAKK